MPRVGADALAAGESGPRGVAAFRSPGRRVLALPAPAFATVTSLPRRLAARINRVGQNTRPDGCGNAFPYWCEFFLYWCELFRQRCDFSGVSRLLFRIGATFPALPDADPGRFSAEVRLPAWKRAGFPPKCDFFSALVRVSDLRRSRDFGRGTTLDSRAGPCRVFRRGTTFCAAPAALKAPLARALSPYKLQWRLPFRYRYDFFRTLMPAASRGCGLVSRRAGDPLGIEVAKSAQLLNSKEFRWRYEFSLGPGHTTGFFGIGACSPLFVFVCIVM